MPKKRKGLKHVYVIKRKDKRIVDRMEDRDKRSLESTLFYLRSQMNSADYTYVVRPYKIKGDHVRVA